MQSSVVFVRLPGVVVLLLGAWGLAGCGHTPFTLTVSEAVGARNSVDGFVLNPSLRYLRVSTSKRTVLMVLGYTELLPQGTLQTWYSAKGEVLHLLNGRLFSSAGLQTDWRSVTFSGLPSWQVMLGQSRAQYKRMRDEMPDYKFGIVETLQLQAVPAPTNSRLKGVSPGALSWFEETVLGTPHGLPSARYALDRRGATPAVVYAEQCMTLLPRPEGCISWQTWPAVQ